MYVIGNPILNDAKCVIQLAFPPYTIVDYRSFRLYIYRRRKRNGSTGRTNSAKGPRVRAHKAAISTLAFRDSASSCSAEFDPIGILDSASRTSGINSHLFMLSGKTKL